MGSHRIGVLTGGGDAPGLNAVIRAIVKDGVGRRHWQAVGIEDSFNGLLDDPRRLHTLDLVTCQGLLHRGGTMLGTTNRGDPFDYPLSREKGAPRADRSLALADAVRDEGLEGLIVIGGDGTQRIAWRLMSERGIPVIGVPKTIDNDLDCTDHTFGFWSAVQAASDALDRLHTTAEAHDRVMLLELMGRDAGWISLYAGVAGGADIIALPEIPYDVERFVRKIHERQRRGRSFTLIVVAEGARPAGEVRPEGSASATLARLLQAQMDLEIRVTVLGHLQRGGTPVAYDRVLATRFGTHAVDLVEQGRWGELVVLRGQDITSVPLQDAVGRTRLVDLGHPLLGTARAVGIELGA